MESKDEHAAKMRKKAKDISERDIEKLQEENMNRCLHVKLDCCGREFLYFNPLTTVLSAVIIWAFVIWCIVEPAESNYHLKNVKSWVTDVWTWLYVGTQDVWSLFIIGLFFSKYANMKLGKDDEKPEYSDGTYFTMLFSCGIAIGLFYYGVAEPILHYKPKGPLYNRYYGRYTDNQRAQDAINITLFHWGIHGWIVYVCIGLLLGFLCYRRGLPMTMRTCFYPILKDKIFGVIGDLIDVLCIICTMFGVCTSLGLGVMQLNAGFHALNTSIPVNTDVQLITIWIITVLATISVISGIKLGIRRLSEVCFAIGCLLLLIVLFADKTWYLLNLIVQSTGYYFQWIIQLGFHTDAFAQLGIAPDKRENKNWMDDWTVFYWGWWISWSPFVGMFIAKISRGRTIREFITYTLTLPCAYSFVWFSTFGGVAIRMENTAVQLGMNCSMYKEPLEDPSRFNTRQAELFSVYGTTMLSCRASTDMWFDVMRSYGDLDKFMSVIAMIAIVLYFITSSDSGSLIIDCLSANGHPEPPVVQRVFWALTEGATATALLVAGGSKALQALQTVSIACGLPFTFVLNWTCVCMWRAVREEAGDIGEEEGRWYRSMFDMNSKGRWLRILISIFCPWYTLVQVRMKLDNLNNIWYRLCYIMMYGLPFYLWIILLIASVKVNSISYVGWAVLFFFFAFAGGLRGDVRERYKLDGNMVEDFFALMLLYPLACMQLYEQVMYAELPEETELKQIEMGVRNSVISDADDPNIIKRSEKV